VTTPAFDPANFRQILHSGYTLVRSIESNKAVSALTLDHIIQGHITALKQSEVRQILDGKGQSVGNRISRWDQLDELEKLFTQAVDALNNAGDDPSALSQLGITDVTKPSNDPTVDGSA